MEKFSEYIRLDEQPMDTPMPPPGGAGGIGGPTPTPPMGGGIGGQPIGGLGGPPGLGMPPKPGPSPGGLPGIGPNNQGQQQQDTSTEIKTKDVWDLLKKLLSGEFSDDKIKRKASEDEKPNSSNNEPQKPSFNLLRT